MRPPSGCGAGAFFCDCPGAFWDRVWFPVENLLVRARETEARNVVRFPCRDALQKKGEVKRRFGK